MLWCVVVLGLAGGVVKHTPLKLSIIMPPSVLVEIHLTIHVGDFCLRMKSMFVVM
jgi:hypothetical protein